MGNDGTELQADVVVFGTGFTKSYSYLDANTQELLGREKDGLWLYRNMFPTRVANLCFVGAEVSTFNNILTQGLQALWLQRVLTGQISLPLPETRDQDIESQKEGKRSWMPAKGDRAAILQLHKMKYHDQLCKDMGVNHKRKGWNLLAEAFAPYSAADYAGLFADRRESSGVMPVLFMTVLLATVFFAGTGSLEIAAIVGMATMIAPTFVDVTVPMLRALLQSASACMKASKHNSLTARV